MFERIQDKRAVLFLSGGFDSLLLLILLIEQGQVFDIVQFRTAWNKKQRERADYWIKKCNLRVYSYPPAAMNFVGDGADVGVIFEYAIGNGSIPLVRDVIKGDDCILDQNGLKMPFAPLDFDIGLVGTRSDDYHPFMGKPVKAETFEAGGMQFICPLWNYTREDVKRELESRGIDTSDVEEDAESGNLSACSECLRRDVDTVWCGKDNKQIPVIDWQPEQNLKAFREAYGF